MWAVIDIGSNTIRLVIYVVDKGRPRPILNKKYAVGLAGYVDKSNRISEKGVRALLGALEDIGTILSYIRPEEVFPFATAALRNSDNGDEIVSIIKSKCALNVRVLTGEEEATFDYYGAAQDGIGERGILVDVGGGSTEITSFRDRRIISATSIPVGSLNLYKMYVDGLLPTPEQARQIKKAVSGYLEKQTPPVESAGDTPLYCVGGTARAALAVMRERQALGGANEYGRAELRRFLNDAKADPRGIMRQILRLAPERIHTIVPGLIVFYKVAKHYGAVSLITSRNGVREGYLMRRLTEKGYTFG